MRTTPWRSIEDGTRRMRVTYGLRKLAGNKYAYFSITGEIQQKEGKRWVEDSCGCLHDAIRHNFPDLADLIPFHLVDETGVPMHYAANARYWLEVVNFVKNAPETPAKATEHFESTVLWGVLPEDKTAELPTLRELDRWLADRLLKLRSEFMTVMSNNALFIEAQLSGNLPL